MADTAESCDRQHAERAMFLIDFAGLFLGVAEVRERVLEAFDATAESATGEEGGGAPIWLRWSVAARERFDFRSVEWRGANALIGRVFPSDPLN